MITLVLDLDDLRLQLGQSLNLASSCLDWPNLGETIFSNAYPCR